MKSVFSVGALTFATMLFFLGCDSAPSAEPTASRSPVPPPEPVFEADLSPATNNCVLVDYKNRTPVSFGCAEGRPILSFVGVAEDPKLRYGVDTAWGLRTKAFPVKAGRDYAVLIEMAGDLPVAAPNPPLKITWLDEKGRNLVVQDALGKDVAFVDGIRSPLPRPDCGPARTYSRGRVPDRAAQAKIDVVVDWPNLLKGARVELRRVAYFEGGADGRLQLGDVEPPMLELLTRSPSRNFTESLRFRLVDASGIDWEKTSISVDGAKVAVASLAKKGDVLSFAPTAPWKADSIHRIEVLATDGCGNAGYDCAFVAFTEKTSRHPACTVRDDGMVLVDGTPIFPLGWFRVRPCAGNGYDLERGVSEMCANGMNFAHTYMRYGLSPQMDGHFDALVAACEKHGVPFYAEPSVRKPKDAAFLPLMEKNLFRGLGYRMPLFWGIGDDTTRHISADELKCLYRCCKSVDPAALTISADIAQPGGQTVYVPYADMLFVEAYPIRDAVPQDDEMAKVAAALDNAWVSTQAANVPGRSVVSIPQAFKGWNLWKRLPTIDEIRCQAYLSIACRARGVVYYASCGESGPNEPPKPGEKREQKHFAPLDSPETKAQFFGLMRELGALAPSLALRDAKEQPAVTVTKGPARNALGGRSVRCLLKEDGLLVLANSAAVDVTASVRLPSGQTLVRDLPRFAGFAEGTSR